MDGTDPWVAVSGRTQASSHRPGAAGADHQIGSDCTFWNLSIIRCGRRCRRRHALQRDSLKQQRRLRHRTKARTTYKRAAWLFRAACFFARNDPAGSAICRHKLGHRRGSSCNYMNAVVPLAYTCRKLWKER